MVFIGKLLRQFYDEIPSMVEAVRKAKGGSTMY